ncbi:hypothetical protein FK535_06770 [Mycolicibacterium sp. 018/SC-01/001]|uniref:hypothetical protein n=1 Tax=Mycolicibacterium sp. 018/SC-01/001 TaxID=2592069 RepID=UPI00117E8FC1|nr:hypothetical protein [Mycolicibacterium sp. 018/SC-01/001]TRW86174.1 hypothetical protein FK535_06770 [Mycolicibacterium sp. 018/SC-01/001]
MAARRDSGGGIAGVFGVLLVVGFIVKYIWFIVGALAIAAVAAGLYYASRAAVRRAEEQRRLAERREEELWIRAERQRRWTMLDDSRAIYGPVGDAATRAVLESPEEGGPVARLARTPVELAALKRTKPRAWQVALFGSVLHQRTAELVPRLRDSRSGFTTGDGMHVSSGPRLADVLLGLIDEMLATSRQLADFLDTCVSIPDEEDADAVEHTAHRLMDYQVRLLELSERCRALSAPWAYTGVIASCARILDTPVRGFSQFFDDYVEVAEALPRLLEHVTGRLEVPAIVLDLTIDDALFDTTTARLEAMQR